MDSENRYFIEPIEMDDLEWFESLAQTDNDIFLQNLFGFEEDFYYGHNND